MTAEPIALTVTPRALAVLDHASTHAARLALAYGDESREHREALRSLNRVLLSILHLGGQLGWADDACLTGLTDDGDTYEVTFHPWTEPACGGAALLPGAWSLHT